MSPLMRCPYCGLLQDEPQGVKQCRRCGGGLEYEVQPPTGKESYLQVQMELDQVAAPANLTVERYLLVTIRAPQQVPAEETASSESGRPPVNFAVVLDVSGSMQGEKITQAKAAVRQAVQYLHEGDVFSLVTFSDQIGCPFEPDLVDKHTSQAVDEALRKISAGGMTALCGGLERGIEKALVHKQETNLVLLLSDGQANVGETDLEKIGRRALEARQQGITASALGVGLDYNEALLAEIATQGGGRFYHVMNANQIPAYLAGELGEVAALAARGVKIHLTIPEGATLLPLSAAYPTQQDGSQTVVMVGDIPCDTELEIPLRLTLVGQPAGSKLSIEGRLTFRSPAGHEHEVGINRVTVRYMEKDKFGLREGVVAPVVERVLTQMQAVNVLGLGRVMALHPEMADQHISHSLQSVREYASLLGEQRAESELHAIGARFSELRNQATAKQTTAAAYAAVRFTRPHA